MWLRCCCCCCSCYVGWHFNWECQIFGLDKAGRKANVENDIKIMLLSAHHIKFIPSHWILTCTRTPTHIFNCVWKQWVNIFSNAVLRLQIKCWNHLPFNDSIQQCKKIAILLLCDQWLVYYEVICLLFFPWYIDIERYWPLMWFCV